MPPPRVTKAFVKSATKKFIRDTGRAQHLYETIALRGHSLNSKGEAFRLSNPDARDAVQFIFFEVAAQFEEFARKMFEVEVRARLKVTASQAEYVMGDLDNGLRGKLGWGDPTRLKDRAKNLFPAGTFFAKLPASLGVVAYTRLIEAHAIRNRVAHSGATKAFVKVLETHHVPVPQRKGMSVGRFLRDYPAGADEGYRNFYRYIWAYETFALKAQARLPPVV